MRLALALVCLTTPAFAQTMDDRHLPVIPRTPGDTAKIAAVLAPPTDFSTPEPFEAKSAGAATVRATMTADAFSQHSANMPFEDEMRFKLGNALFRKTLGRRPGLDQGLRRPWPAVQRPRLPGLPPEGRTRASA